MNDIKNDNNKKIYPGYLCRHSHIHISRRIICIVSVLLVFIICVSAANFKHEVLQNETLYSISRSYGISVRQIQLANNMDNESSIRVGQQLNIPLQYYIVDRGDTISSIALKYGVTEHKLIQLNKMTNSNIRLGEYIIIPQKPTMGQTYVVQKGDTLSYISMRFDISQTILVRLNDLSSPQLRVGQVLQLTSNRPSNYLVKQNDTLYSIANKYSMSVDQLMQYNALNSTSIRPGMELEMFSPTYSVFDDDIWQPEEKREEIKNNIKFASLQSSVVKPNNNTIDNFKGSQPSFTYSKDVFTSIEVLHKQAKNLLASYDKEIDNLDAISNKLKGYSIVLDSGHGGVDPGAVVAKKYNGKEMYFVEDEYAYDITMRLYALLKRNGANVYLTVLSPDNLVRDNNMNETFMNVKNEVYNYDYTDLNYGYGLRGGSKYLQKRTKLANKIFKQNRLDKCIFISVHLDSSQGTDLGHIAVFNNPSENTIKLANNIINHTGRGKIVEDQYIILNGNIAPAAVLVEIRNIEQEAVELVLDYKNRQQDAQKLANAILDYASSR